MHGVLELLRRAARGRGVLGLAERKPPAPEFRGEAVDEAPVLGTLLDPGSRGLMIREDDEPHLRSRAGRVGGQRVEEPLGPGVRLVAPQGEDLGLAGKSQGRLPQFGVRARGRLK